MKNDRRAQWKTLKNKHKDAIKTAKVDFDQKLGPALDKYQSQVDTLSKLATKGEITTQQVQPVFIASQALKNVVTGYMQLVETIGEPARKELKVLLKTITADIQGWEEFALRTQRAPDKVNDDQIKAVRTIMPVLANIHASCTMLVTRGNRAADAYRNEGRPEAAAMMSQLAERARLAGSASFELTKLASNVTTGSNYDLFKSRAKNVAVLLQKTRQAGDALIANWVKGAAASTFCENKGTQADAMTIENNHKHIMQGFDQASAFFRTLA